MSALLSGGGGGNSSSPAEDNDDDCKKYNYVYDSPEAGRGPLSFPAAGGGGCWAGGPPL